MPEMRTLDDLEAAISLEIKSIKTVRRRIDRYVDKNEALLTDKAELLGELIRKYNRTRLDSIIEMLIDKGLAYYAPIEQLVREQELKIKTVRGVEDVWRGCEYYEYEERRHYERTYLRSEKTRGDGLLIASGTSVREAWVESFREKFSLWHNESLPGWLLIAIEESQLPREAIGFRTTNSYSETAQPMLSVERRGGPFLHTRFRRSQAVNRFINTVAYR